MHELNTAMKEINLKTLFVANLHLHQQCTAVPFLHLHRPPYFVDRHYNLQYQSLDLTTNDVMERYFLSANRKINKILTQKQYSEIER